jgi:amino acid permease
MEILIRIGIAIHFFGVGIILGFAMGSTDANELKAFMTRKSRTRVAKIYWFLVFIFILNLWEIIMWPAFWKGHQKRKAVKNGRV